LLAKVNIWNLINENQVHSSWRFFCLCIFMDLSVLFDLVEFGESVDLARLR
jgi:hypothetical protein